MDVWTFIQLELHAGHRVMLMVVVDLKGSTPGRPGYKMAVSESGKLAGSVGGGTMEYNMVSLARDLLGREEADPIVVRQVHDPNAETDRSGLLCSGLQVNLLYPMEAVHLEVVDALVEAFNNDTAGTLDITPDYIGFREDGYSNEGVWWEMQSENEWHYREGTGLKNVITIFGGGHLSLPLSQVFRMLGFRVVVVDDRESLNTMENNLYAHQKEVVDYMQAAEMLEEGDHSYAAIMTVSHATDQMILERLLPKRLRYLGMIASKKKAERIFSALRASGASEELLSKVDSPMGIDIGSQTVQEIAISIAAKIIQVKNTKLTG